MVHPSSHRALRLRSSILGLALFLAAVATACGGSGGAPQAVSPRGAAPAFPVTLKDDDGVPVTLPSAPQRIITFAPSNTEIVFALGLGSRLVGVSGSFDDYPPQAKTIEQVGGSGEFGADPNVEKVVSLHPDLMLAISGGDQWKEQLRRLDIPVFTLNAVDLDDLIHDIDTVGRLTGTAEAAAKLTAGMTDRAGTIQAETAKEAPVSCFFEAYFPPLTTTGPHTFIFDLLRRAGCDPVSKGANTDYPEWSIDKLVQEGPSVYLVASESGVSAEAVAKRPGFGAIAAVRDGKVFLIDSDLVSRPGPRVVDGLLALARVLHPAVVQG
jgi:iron complex transport system substrate-binding protein